MKASYLWLKELVPGLQASAKEIADRLTRAGLEVEGIQPWGEGLEPLVVAGVRKVEPHPSRSGLRLVTVDRGEGHEQRVVCGAANVPGSGGLVVLAPLGTRLPAIGVTLGAREIGGVVSEGMLCSESELGLAGGESDGIIVLEAGTVQPGTPFLSAEPSASDHVLEINVTPNRADALGHIGLARELAALFDLAWALPKHAAPNRVAPGHASEIISVTVNDAERCPLYAAAVVVDVTIGPSPAWLRYRLASLGVRPISNVVDVTNLVLFEYGHPLHAFDLDRVRGGGRITVRTATAGESMATLDGKDRHLDPDDLVICDEEGPVALAGVMGGASSEITRETRRILLECAYFTPRGVRRAARRHGVHTESSHRFERGVDPGDTHDVIARTSLLFGELAGGKTVPGVVEVRARETRRPAISLSSARLDKLLGVPVPFDEALGILRRLGFGVGEENGSPVGAPKAVSRSAKVDVPTHRPDISREVDLIEEVLRVRGLDTVPTVLPPIRPQTPRRTGVTQARIRTAAVELGLDEAITYGFVSPRALEAVGAPPATIVLANPLSAERSVMRTSLLPGLLDAVARAFRRGESQARLFSVGACFFPPGEKRTSAGSSPLSGPALRLPDERPSFAAVLAGLRSTYLGRPEPHDLYDAKAMATEIVERVTRRKPEVVATDDATRPKHLHPRAAALLTLDGKPLASFGLLHPDVLERFELASAVAVVEIDIRALEREGASAPRFSPLPRIPAVTRDIALLVNDDIDAGAVERIIRDVAGDLCESVVLFDLFRGGSVPENHRSLAFHVVYRDPRAATAPEDACTLTDVEVDERHAAVIQAANARVGATLRA